MILQFFTSCYLIIIINIINVLIITILENTQINPIKIEFICLFFTILIVLQIFTKKANYLNNTRFCEIVLHFLSIKEEFKDLSSSIYNIIT